MGHIYILDLYMSHSTEREKELCESERKLVRKGLEKVSLEELLECIRKIF